MIKDRLPPIHPGYFVKEHLQSANINPAQFAVDIGMPESTVTDLVAAKIDITDDLAARLGKAFGTTVQFG